MIGAVPPEICYPLRRLRSALIKTCSCCYTPGPSYAPGTLSLDVRFDFLLCSRLSSCRVGSGSKNGGGQDTTFQVSTCLPNSVYLWACGEGTKSSDESAAGEECSASDMVVGWLTLAVRSPRPSSSLIEGSGVVATRCKGNQGSLIPLAGSLVHAALESKSKRLIS